MDALGERMDRGFTEIKEMLYRFDERLRDEEKNQAGYQPVITARLDAAWRRIDKHDQDMDKLNEALIKITKTVSQLESVSKWMLGILTAVIVAIMVAFVTGRIELLIK